MIRIFLAPGFSPELLRRLKSYEKVLQYPRAKPRGRKDGGEAHPLSSGV